MSDQVKQSYIQLTYGTEIESSYLTATYINGIALFNRFDERNYLEHSLHGNYALRFGGAKTKDLTMANGSDNGSTKDAKDSTSIDPETIEVAGIATKTADDSTGEETVVGSLGDEVAEDSTDVYLGLGFKLSNRLDKSAYSEFDNAGIEQHSSFRVMLGESIVLRLNNTFGYRSYTNLPELSNVNNVLNVQVRNASNASIGLGLNVGGGVKHYVNTVTDSSKFEAVRSYITKPAGRGKPGGKFKSTKLLLANAGTSTSYQVVAGLFGEKKWPETSIAYDILVRVNSKKAPRYLAQSTGASGLNEDIYNDQFSYAGWETKLTVSQQLFAWIQASALVEFQRKKFGAAAYNLGGDQTSNNRLDLRSIAELTLTKTISLFQGVDLELTLIGGLLRNQSNDEYSDFSAASIAFGLGMGV